MSKQFSPFFKQQDLFWKNVEKLPLFSLLIGVVEHPPGSLDLHTLNIWRNATRFVFHKEDI